MSDCHHENLIHSTFETPSKGKQPYSFHVIRCKDCNQLLAVCPIEIGTGLLQIVTSGFSEVMRAIATLERSFKQR